MNIEQLLQAWIEAFKDQGPIIVILGIIAIFFMYRSDKAHSDHIKTLRDEIERLVESRNRLEIEVLNNRRSSNNNEEDGKNE